MDCSQRPDQGTDVPRSPGRSSADRHLRVDLVRGVALLIIFSDHVVGNPIRDFMPISLGFSDMAEVFIFLSGYVNGIRRANAEFPCRMGRQLVQTLARCLQLYAVILLMLVLTAWLQGVHSPEHAGRVRCGVWPQGRVSHQDWLVKSAS